MPRQPFTVLDAEVVRVQDLGPTFRRVTFGGEGMRRFGPAGHPLDLRLKLVIPPEGAERFDLPALFEECAQGEGLSWYQAWLRVPEERRGAMRTYSVRAWRDAERELDVDMVMHGESGGASGPAAHWAATASVGDRIHIVGPDREAAAADGGIEFRPGGARDVLLAGDETAVPAIASILSALEPDVSGCVILEVPREEDVQELTAPDGVDVRWLVRGAARPGEMMEKGVREVVRTREAAGSLPHTSDGSAVELEEVDIDRVILWDVPQRLTAAAHGSAPAQAADGDAEDPKPFYAWIAGEAAAVRAIRRYLVREVGVDRRQVAFMGYWRIGRAEG